LTVPDDSQRTQIMKALEQRAVLLLGQGYLAERNGRGPVACALADHTSGAIFNDWWLAAPQRLLERARLVADIGRAVPLDDARVTAMRKVQWACAFTSAIDTLVKRLLQLEGRPVLELFQRQDHPDSAALPLFRLFGSVDRPPDGAGLPPSDKKALPEHRARANDMLAALPDLIGPSGVLFIEGWAPRGDWLRPRDLGLALQGKGLARGQVLLFGVASDDPSLDDEDFQPLIHDGVVVCFALSLAELLAELREEGLLDRLVGLQLVAGEVLLDVSKQTPERLATPDRASLCRLAVHPQEWRSLNETFEILQPLTLSQPLTGTPDELSRNFREFLAHGPDVQLNRVRQFAFRRPVLDREILPQVLELLAKPSPQDFTVVLTGQSGCGKTTLMALLAVELREAGFPVVYIRRSSVPPSYGQLDKFAQMVEGCGARLPVAVVHDGLLEPHEYMRLARFLGSRGRKALVVGSSYGEESISPAGPQKKKKNLRVLRVSVHMLPDERQALQMHLARFHANDPVLLRLLDKASYNNFFAFLYQLLGSGQARDRLAAGLIREIESHVAAFDQRIEELVSDHGPGWSGLNAFQLAWFEALGARASEVAASTPKEEDGLDGQALRSEALRLVDTVMVAGQFGVDVPQSLALRLLRTDRSRAYREALNAFHAVEVREVRPQVYVLGTRHPVEAVIWCGERVPDRTRQFDVLAYLAEQLRGDEARDDRSLECDTVIRLLRTVGPQGPDPRARIPETYHRIAEVVRDLRRQHGRIHERLLLLEGNSVRESVRHHQEELTRRRQAGAADEAECRRLATEWLEQLAQAEASLDVAILQSRAKPVGEKRGPGFRRFMAVLETEQACICGVQQGSLVRLARTVSDLEDARYDEMDAHLKRATAAWRRAMAYDDDNFHAHDAACWIYKERHEAGRLSDEREAEILADWHDIIERCRLLDLDPRQEDRLDYHEGCLATATADLSRFEKIVERMQERGSPAAHTMKARYLASSKGSVEARSYLESVAGLDLLRDRSLLLYYYRLWWQTETGLDKYFPDYHLTLPFRRDQWQRLGDLAEARRQLEGERDNCLALFHLSWSCLQLGQGERAREVLAHLDAASGESFRRGRTLALLADAGGLPRELTAETRGRADTRGRAWIDELRLDVNFSLFDFPDVGTRSGRLLGPFHLALNYRGAFAQPINRYRRSTPETT
jgi:hypothetical protein